MGKTGVRISGLWLVLALVLSACQPSQAPAAVQATSIPAPTAAQATSVPAPTAAQVAPQGARPDAPTYAVHGPFAVGYKPLVIGAGTNHPLEGSLWYPALNPTGRKEEITYDITLKDTSWSTDLPKIIYGHALLNAEFDDSKNRRSTMPSSSPLLVEQWLDGSTCSMSLWSAIPPVGIRRWQWPERSMT